MALPTHGNGSGQIQIHVSDKGGWVVVYPGQHPPLPADIPILLSRTLEDWFRERPQVRLRSACPIVQDGNTIILHGFYEQVSWPQPVQPMPPPPGG